MSKILIYFLVLSIIFTYANTHLLQPRHKAPDFTALAVTPSKDFKTIKLSDYAGKYLIIVFYPFDFTYVCPT